MTRHHQVQLLNCIKSPGFSLILDIMESCLTLAETEHLALKPLEHSDNAIARSHAETRGQRILFERLQAKIALEVDYLVRLQTSEKPQEAAEPSEENILDPTQK